MKRKSFQSNKRHLRDDSIETLNVDAILKQLSEVELSLNNLHILNSEQLNFIEDTELVTSDKSDLQRIINEIVSLKNQVENQTSDKFNIGEDDYISGNSSTTQLVSGTKDTNEMDDSDDEIQLVITYSEENDLNLREDSEENSLSSTKEEEDESKSRIKIEEGDIRSRPKYCDNFFYINNSKMKKLLDDMFGINKDYNKQKMEYKLEVQSLLNQFLSSSDNKNAVNRKDQIYNLVNYFKNNSNFHEYYQLECLSSHGHFNKSFIQKQITLKEQQQEQPKRTMVLDYSERDILAKKIKNILKKQNELDYTTLQRLVKSKFNKNVTKVGCINSFQVRI
ncbi:hypothetical protein QTN25_007137 [Entamoeba marina]